MRISTSLLFDRGALGIQRNQSALFTTQNQISSGRRMLSPEDDPVAAAQVLVVSQSKAVNAQYIDNQSLAKSQLGLLEGQLGTLGNLIQNVRERAVQLGNATLSNNERSFIAEELRQRFTELVGIGNAQDGQGQYLFSGFQGTTKPFATNSPPGVAPFAAANPYVAYAGDDGDRLLQVDSARQMAISASGTDVFMRVKQGNGTFAAAANSANTGSGVIDQGSILDVSQWNSSLIQPQSFRIDFQIDNSGASPVVKYNLIDTASGNSLYTNAAPGAVTAADWKVFTPGQAISFTGLDPAVAPGGNLGAQVSISGTPSAGDSFTVAASQNQSLFDTFQNLIAAAVQPAGNGSAGNALLANRLGESLGNLDQALNNVLRVRAAVGSSLSELDTLGSAAADKDLQYDQHLSALQDLDYAAAITDLSKRQLQLEAAQRSFVRISELSLFSLL